VILPYPYASTSACVGPVASELADVWLFCSDNGPLALERERLLNLVDPTVRLTGWCCIANLVVADD